MTDTISTPIRVLIVDDHPGTAATLARAVSQLGSAIDVVSADSGERALELVQNKTADLLITDMMMPGMNGLELIERLQSHPGGRPSYIILITAYDVPGLKETARRLKVNDVIIKPIRPERIFQLVNSAIESMGQKTVEIVEADTKPRSKILIVDDLPDNVALLSRYLQNEGYICLTASNGVEALAKTRAEMPDLLLLDVNMPVKDGFETLQEIRTDPSIGHIPVIFLTARMEPMDMQSALNMGADDYVTKPFDRRELLARIRTRLRVKEAEDVMRRRNKELNLLPEIGKELSARLDIDELGNIVLRRTTETMGALLGYMVILARDGIPQKTYHFSVSSPVTMTDPKLPSLKNLLVQIRETRQGIIINDAHTDSRWPASGDENVRSVVVAPMFGRYEVLGLLILVHEKVGYFSMEHKLLLQAIASQAAIALENAQLYFDLTKEQRQVNGLTQTPPAKAVLVIDNQARVVFISSAGEQLFANAALKTGEMLSRGRGYDTLLDFWSACKSREAKMGTITCRDDLTLTSLLVPIEDDGCAILLYDIRPSGQLSKTLPAI